MSETRHVDGLPFTRPDDSAGKPSPVGLPKPSVAIWAASLPSPSCWAISMVPMFDDWARICVAVSRSVGWFSASWNTHPSMVSELGTAKTSSGEINPSCSAAENVTSLNTDPGSYTWASAKFCGACTTVVMGGGGGGGAVVVVLTGVEPAGAVVGVGAGGVVGTGAGVVLATRFAMDRISPVRLFMTIAMPLLACDARISAPRDCSVTYCRGSSMASSTPVPGTVAPLRMVLPGRGTPSGDTSSTEYPLRPANSGSY